MRRTPWLTVATLAITAAVTVVQLRAPDTLERLERTPAVRHGEPWRLLTSLLVQDGGASGALINLLGLAVLGVLAEQVVSRPWWLVAYLVPGLTGETVAVWWQPTGGGNSVAVCGLAGVVALVAWRGRTSGLSSTSRGIRAVSQDCARVASVATLLWVVLMLTSAWVVVFVPGVMVAVVAGALVRGRAALVVPAVATAGALTLTAVRNIHGAALLTGLVLAMTLAATGRLPDETVGTSPGRFWQSEGHE